MKKTLFLFLLVFSSFAVPANATKFDFSSYYPAPTGNYQSLHLTPQSALTTSNCNLGTLYANADDNSLPYFCAPNAVDIPTFSPIAGPWTLNNNDLFLTDTTTPSNKKVGIGTTTPTFKLTIENDGGILADGPAASSSALPVSDAGTRMMWYPAKGAFRAGSVSANQWNDGNIGTSSVAMGNDNIAASQGASVWGGQNNSASGGASPFAPVIAGGLNNTTTSELAQILGGSGNSAGISERVAGKNNISIGSYSMIGGGENNLSVNNYSTILGGYANNTNALASTISGGGQNITTSANYSTILGGNNNVIFPTAPYSTIAGGQNNGIFGSYSVISGGNLNTSLQSYNTISGGNMNVTNKIYNTIAGGNTNSTNGTASSISGGANNSTSGDYSTVIGGSANTASGNYAIVPGGANNTASGAYSLAAGRFMTITGARSFVWGYAASAITPIVTPDAMIIYSGSMGIRDTNPAALLEINGNGSTDDYLNLTSTQNAPTPGDRLTIKKTVLYPDCIGVNGCIGVDNTDPHYPLHFGNGAFVTASGFMPASSRKLKENIADLNLAQALDAFTKLAPVQYNYKNTKNHHLGFIAEDVPDLVADQSRQGLAPMDIAAVLTKVIAHQHNLIEQQKNETNTLLKEFNELKNKAQHKNSSKARLKNL